MASRRIIREENTKEVIDGHTFYRYRTLDSFTCGRDFVVPKDTLSGLIHEDASLSPTDACWVDYNSIIDQKVSVSGTSYVESSLIQPFKADGASIIVAGDSIIVDTNINVNHASLLSCYIEKSGIVFDGTLIIYSNVTLVDVMVQDASDLIMFRGKGYTLIRYKHRMTEMYNVELILHNSEKPEQPYVVSTDGVEISVIKNSYFNAATYPYSIAEYMYNVQNTLLLSVAQESAEKIMSRVESILKAYPFQLT